MKAAIRIEARLTTRYVQGYAHLDNWVRVCDAYHCPTRGCSPG